MEAYGFIHDKGELIRLSREGIMKSTFLEVLTETGLTLNELSYYLDISPRTIQKKKPDDKLSKDVSAKVLAIAKLYSKGEEVFGDEDKFRRWMNTVNSAMGGVPPISFLDLIEGINLIMDELTAIEHGFAA
jgi:putative toxin-antitoxin system antitoxin component (TIGR02293 family)